MLGEVPPVISFGRSLPLLERDAPSTCEPADEEEERWDLVVALQGPTAMEHVDDLPSRQAFVLGAVLDGRRPAVICRALGVALPSLARVFDTALATVASALPQTLLRERGRRLPSLSEVAHMSRKRPTKPPEGDTPMERPRCAVEGCARFAEPRRKGSTELQPFCNVHARARAIQQEEQAERRQIRLAIDALPPPDRARAAAICRGNGKPRIEAHDISPTLALALLERNKKNRTPSPKRVHEYASIMRKGEWLATSQGITLGKDGTLFDGQHRLLAIVESGRTVRMYIATNFDEDTRAGLDLGRGRSMGNTVQMLDEEPDAAQKISWLRAIQVLHRRGHHRLALPDARRSLARHRASLDWMVAHGPKRRPEKHTAVVGALAYAHMVLGKEIEPFIAGFATGARLEEGDPAMVLRRYLTEQLMQRKDPKRVMQLKALQCVRAYVRGAPIERLLGSEDGYEMLLEREDGERRRRAK